MERPILRKAKIDAAENKPCPECGRRGKWTDDYSSHGAFIPMILTQCEFCKKFSCGHCWEKHYERHTGKHPGKDRNEFERESSHRFNFSESLSDLLESNSGGVHSDLAPGARVSLSLTREEISRLHRRMRARIYRA